MRPGAARKRAAPPARARPARTPPPPRPHPDPHPTLSARSAWSPHPAAHLNNRVRNTWAGNGLSGIHNQAEAADHEASAQDSAMAPRASLARLLRDHQVRGAHHGPRKPAAYCTHPRPCTPGGVRALTPIPVPLALPRRWW